MKKRLLSFVMFTSSICLGLPYITYRLNGGRLGDNILNCLKCLSMAHKYSLHFVPKPFPYSNYFFKSAHAGRSKPVMIRREDNIPQFLNQDVLLVTDYYFQTNPFEAIKDPSFKKLIQSIFMKEPNQKIAIPEGYHSVAIHIRKGSKGDLPLLSDQKTKNFADKYYPLKFPPNQYYIDQLRLLIKLLSPQKLFVYIFTDYTDPSHLKKVFYKEFGHNADIIIDCRDNRVPYDTMIIDDFLSMMRFDYLIRSESNYSKVAHIIGKNKIVILPVSHTWKGRILLVDTVKIVNTMNNSEELVHYS